MIVSSIRKLAAELGISHTMLNRQYSRGKFKEEPGGGFDVDKVRAALARNADVAQPSQSKKADRPQGESDAAENAGSTYDLFNRARAVKEMAVAKEKQLNLRQRQDELLEASDVERAWSAGLTAFSNRLLLIPDKLAAKVAACNNVLECRALIEEEIRAAIRALSEINADAT
jgi:hypothetical protein